MQKDPRSEELQAQHEHQEQEMIKHVAAVLGKIGLNCPGDARIAEMLVEQRRDLRHALGF